MGSSRLVSCSATSCWIAAIGRAIRELGEVPSGQLYSHIMGAVDLQYYNYCIDTLKKAKLITENNNLLKWIGPA